MPRVSLNTDSALRERKRILYERYGGFMTTANIMKELGVSRTTAMKFTSGLTAYLFRGRRLYDVRDVAAKIESGRIPPEVLPNE